jgi:hypothetical protein
MNQSGYGNIHGNVTRKLYSYLTQTKMCFFFFFKNREQKGKADPVWGVGTSGRGKMKGKGVGG